MRNSRGTIRPARGLHVRTPILDHREMALMQLVQSALGLFASVLAAFSQMWAQRHERDAGPTTWRSEGCPTGAPAIVTLRLGSG